MDSKPEPLLRAAADRPLDSRTTREQCGRTPTLVRWAVKGWEFNQRQRQRQAAVWWVQVLDTGQGREQARIWRTEIYRKRRFLPLRGEFPRRRPTSVNSLMDSEVGNKHCW